MMENINPVSPEIHFDEMAENASHVVSVMKALSHEVRLMLLWHLTKGEKTVSELANLQGLNQSTVSQQLARLRLEGLIKGRRQGRAVFYHLEDQRVQNLIKIICSMYCASKVV